MEEHEVTAIFLITTSCYDGRHLGDVVKVRVRFVS